MQKSRDWYSSDRERPRRNIIEPGPVPTLGQLQTGEVKWVWAYCERMGCSHVAPVALAPYVIRWGPDASSDVLRERLKCAKCGRKGATLKHPSWYEWGWQPWPAVFSAA